MFASPERHLVFDINDFDETLPGPWEWDVKRLATSLEIAGRDQRATPRRRAATIVLAAVRGVPEAMREFAGMRDLEVWYAHADVETAALSSAEPRAAPAQGLARSVAKARTKDNLGRSAKLTTLRRRRAAGSTPTRP